jgi:hypothetical protein
MSHDDEAHEQAEKMADAPPVYAPRDEDHWRHQMYTPTSEDRAHWAEAGLPDDELIVGGFLMNNPLVHGVPDKSEIFRLADITTHGDNGSPFNDGFDPHGYMNLRVVKPPMLGYNHILLHPHLVSDFGDVHEHHYIVQLSVVSVEMVLSRIRVITGSRTDDGEQIMFEGTECPGPMMHHRIRVIRITVHQKNYATYEVVSETKYPQSRF